MLLGLELYLSGTVLSQHLQGPGFHLQHPPTPVLLNIQPGICELIPSGGGNGEGGEWFFTQMASPPFILKDLKVGLKCRVLMQEDR
jgi:hypothetical protein